MFRTSSRQLTAYRQRSLQLYSSPPPSFTTPKPPSLPLKDKKEWEASMRRQQVREETALGEDSNSHPDARKPVIPDFEGDANPVTGEIGGPQKEPLVWGANGEWTLGGRATDF